MRLAEDKKGLCGLHSPFLYGSELCAGFYPVGSVRHAVVPFCQFVRVGKMDIQANAEKKGSLICEYGKEGLFLPCNETNAMTVTFEETYLQELYEKGKTSDKPKMIANNLTPSEPIHPGEMIKDEIEYRGISQRKLAVQMGISPTLLNEILNGKRAISTEYALLFEAALGIDAEIWLRLQADYDMQVAKSNKSFLERLAQVRKLAAAAAL